MSATNHQINVKNLVLKLMSKRTHPSGANRTLQIGLFFRATKHVLVYNSSNTTSSTVFLVALKAKKRNAPVIIGLSNRDSDLFS